MCEQALELALKLLTPYVLRGDSEESMRHSCMGSYGPDGRVQIGGHAWSQSKLIKFQSDEVVVSMVQGKQCLYIWKLGRMVSLIQRANADTGS